MNKDGIPLPSALSGVEVERLIRTDEALLFLVLGALVELTDNWWLEQTGTLTADDAKQALNEMLWCFMEGCEVPNPQYPESFLIWPPMAKVIAGGALTIGNFTNMIPLYTVNFTAPAINNRIQFPFFARSGVYDITVHGLRTTSAAKVQIFTDENSSPITEVDMYGAPLYNVDWLFGSVPFLNSGHHTIDFKAYAKHASSTNYGMWFTWIRGVRTADYP